MEDRRDIPGIIWISLPFCAGVGIGEALPTAGLPVWAWIAAGVSVAAAVGGLTAAASSRQTSRILVVAVFLLLGLFSSLSHTLSCPTRNRVELVFAEKCMERFTEAIENVPFRDVGTTAMLRALLTGDRSGMDADVTRAFRNAGAAHILALSGLHLGIIYGIVVRLLAILGNSRAARILRAMAAITLSGFYTVMTGAGPSIQRAFLFIAMNEILRLSPGRKRVPAAILCTALTIQLCMDPSVIRSPGFQLSYLSMTGIITVFPVLEGWYPKGNGKDPIRAIWVSAALSISCQLFTAPLVYLRFGTFPKYFLLTNLLALPLTEILIVTGLAATVLTAAGICPELPVRVAETASSVMSFALEAISSM